MNAAIVVLAVSFAAGPEDSFREGLSRRENAPIAKAAFAKAAGQFDLATPDSALVKSRAHFLAGQTPQALAAIHAGLKLAPYHRELQGDLLAIRDSLRYPESSDPRLRVRPDVPRFLRHRVSPWDLFLVTAAFGTFLAIGIAMRATTRPTWASAAAGIGFVGLAVSIVLSVRIAVSEPLPIILANAVTLRTGNGENYPAKIADLLPRGAEVRELGRRGGWIRVELAGGGVGWLPETAILR